MKTKRVGFILMAVCLLLGWAVGTAAAPPTEEMTTEEWILTPGTAASCPHDFILENADKETVELQLMLGNEPFMQDRIEPNDAKAYGLHHNLTEAMAQGKEVMADDWATVLHTGEKGSLRMYCME
ncbi:hypothetical protein [Nitrospina gracilis]|uniref:hypothetical protein n=1 Tax=Nitrospina gracilis TaxID=35801 RepID=UPI001F40A242|nr:hypothetical protein [Nitrospina gracilis]MCF8721796.1 hypothetical protein [Nitrospina gracilis Nb-211]